MLLSVDKVAEMLGVSQSTLRLLDDRLPSIKTTGGHRRYHINDVNSYLQYGRLPVNKLYHFLFGASYGMSFLFGDKEKIINVARCDIFVKYNDCDLVEKLELLIYGKSKDSLRRLDSSFINLKLPENFINTLNGLPEITEKSMLYSTFTNISQVSDLFCQLKSADKDEIKVDCNQKEYKDEFEIQYLPQLKLKCIDHSNSKFNLSDMIYYFSANIPREKALEFWGK